MASIPEAERAIQVIKDWIRDLLYNLTPWTSDRRHFLTDAAELMTLAFVFDRTGARDYIARARFFVEPGQRLRELVRGKGGERYILHDLFLALSASEPSSVAAGVLFLHTVIEDGVAMNINVFCQLFDYICASFILHHRLHKNGSLHDTTLSRRWIVSLCGSGSLEPKDTGLLLLLLRPLRDLMREAHYGSSGTNFLVYERNTTKIEMQIRNIFVARICYNICLLGYNIPGWQLRNDIHRTITSIRQPSRLYSRLIVKYIKASTWDDLVRALRSTAETEASDFDHLVQLKDSSKVTGPTHPIRGIRPVVYTKPEDIVPLVNGAKVETAPQAKSTLRAEAAPFIPARFLKADVGVEEDEEEDDDDDEPVDDPSAQEEDAGIDHSVDLDAAARTVDAARVEQTVAPPSVEEIAAAKRIALMYRRLLSRRHGVPKKGLPAARLRWFISCQELSQDFDRPYRLLFLGPFPHALVCLEKLNAYAINSKKNAHMRLRIAPQEVYEKVKVEVDNAIRLTKDVAELKKRLDTKSKLHAEQNYEELRQGIVRLEELSASLPESVSQEWDWDLKMVVKGIVQQKAPPRKKVKPELVIDDDDLY